jgi:MFS family permease
VAFWFDAATYLASAGLLATIVVPPLVKRTRRSGAGATSDERAAQDAGEETAEESEDGQTSVLADLKAGWAFLRRETVLLANTVQGAAGQFSLGVLLVASVVLAREITAAPEPAYRATYAFMETAIGLGSLIGGFVLGALAGRAPRGKLIISAYIAFGVGAVALGLVSSVGPVLLILFGMGIANMAFVIPSQTLFQERTPPELMGRVVSFRFALVFGGMSLAMAIGGLLIELFTAGPVIMAAGLLSIAAGVGGLFLRQVREA